MSSACNRETICPQWKKKNLLVENEQPFSTFDNFHTSDRSEVEAEIRKKKYLVVGRSQASQA